MAILDGDEGRDDGTVEDFAAFEAQATGKETPGADPSAGDPPADLPPAAGADEGAADPGEGDAGEGDEGEGDEETPAKPEKTAKDRIRELNRAYREEQKQREIDRGIFEARIAALENKGLTPESKPATPEAKVAPDPSDTEKYPLGILDDRYQEDSLNFKAEQIAAKLVETALQRQEQNAEQAAAEALVTELRSKADSVAAKGSEIHEDYQELVYEAGMRGDYDLTQTTFEAAVEAEHGAEILYALATDKAEAARVAKLTPFQQLKFVAEKNAELAKSKSARVIPGAPPPPSAASGRTSRSTISPDTENFEEFERLANASK